MGEFAEPQYELIESKTHPGNWFVSALGPDGELWQTEFQYAHAKERAEEYAAWKNGVAVTGQKLWVVETGTQELNLVCRVFAREEDAQAYAATAREWLARHGKYPGEDPRYRKVFYRHWLNHAPGHRADLVDEAKAASEIWPFGDDPCSDFFTVTAYPFQPAAGPDPQAILNLLLAYDDHLPNCEKWPECQCGYMLALMTARGYFLPKNL